MTRVANPATVYRRTLLLRRLLPNYGGDNGPPLLHVAGHDTLIAHAPSVLDAVAAACS